MLSTANLGSYPKSDGKVNLVLSFLYRDCFRQILIQCPFEWVCLDEKDSVWGFKPLRLTTWLIELLKVSSMRDLDLAMGLSLVDEC